MTSETSPVPPTEPSPARRFRMRVNPPVFFISAGLTLAFTLLATFFATEAGLLFDRVQTVIVRDFGWFYILATTGFLGFVLFLMFSRYGDIRLGPDDSEPEYSYLSWFSMLFSAGMGIGLIFFGVAEPLQHYASPPVGEGGSIEAARQAMMLTFFHWGLHAWAIYIVVGLALAYFAFRRGLPLTLRSALYPLIGNRIHGPIGHAIDIFAVLGTLFGLATSLGLGVLQINSGFSYLIGAPAGIGIQVLLIAGIMGIATLSAVAGVDRGIKRLSELNIILALALLLFVLFAGSTVFLLQAYIQNIGLYLGGLVERSFRLYAYEPNPWLGNWTLFYWGWWIAWSPFVGMFIARISRGRTIREFIAGVLIAPVLFTGLWMTVFGNTAIDMDLHGTAALAETVRDNLPAALFELLRQFPWASFTAGVTTLLIITFFVTSADSGALVIDMITSGAAEDAPVWQRIFWALSAGAVAAALLFAGGLEALQTASIASALPFAGIMILMCYGLLRALQMEGKGAPIDLSRASFGRPRSSVGWQRRLLSLARDYSRADIQRFLQDTAQPALEAVAGQLREAGLEPGLHSGDEACTLSVPHGAEGDFRYTVRIRAYRQPSFSWAEARSARSAPRHHYRAIAVAVGDDETHDVSGYSRDQLIEDLLGSYARFRERTLIR